MAELLIYKATHWMDKLTSEQWEAYRATYPNWEQKYAGRWQRGQVVEVRPDGFWSKRGIYPRTDVFRVVLLPGVTVMQTRYLMEPGIHERRRYVVDSGTAKEVDTIASLAVLVVTDRSLAGG